MKILTYVLLLLFGVMMSCQEENIIPRGGEDDPIEIPPPPDK